MELKNVSYLTKSYLTKSGTVIATFRMCCLITLKPSSSLKYKPKLKFQVNLI